LTELTFEAGGEGLLRRALSQGVPVVAVLGQSAGWSAEPDNVLIMAAGRLGRPIEGGWRGLLSREAVPDNFDLWIAERFARRAPSAELLSIADAPLSAVFTSSIDPGLSNLLTTGGREPEPVMIGDPLPPVSRSKRRPPVFYLFGRAAPGPQETRPPTTIQALAQRRLRHAAPMLRGLNEAATPVGLIVVDGYIPERDWIKPDELLASLAGAAAGGVLWCGVKPDFSGDEAESYSQLLSDGIVVEEPRSLGILLAELRATSLDEPQQNWDDPEVVTVGRGKRLITSAKLRLATQSSALIIDDSISGFLAPLGQGQEESAFANFHSAPSSARERIEGVRRGFAFEREFEKTLQLRVHQAMQQHHAERGAIIVHGQSGVGKSVALARLAQKIKEEYLGAVLYASERLPNPSDLSTFLTEVDQAQAATLLIVDIAAPPSRFDELLESLRSRGHRVVVVGTAYRIERQIVSGDARFIEAPEELTSTEQELLEGLASKFGVQSKIKPSRPHALARFYWQLPGSRQFLAQGLGREARSVQRNISRQGRARAVPRQMSGLGAALVASGYADGDLSLFPADQSALADMDGSSASARVVDYIMAASRVDRAVPVNLVLRAIIGADDDGYSFGVDIVRDVFQDQDLFRWHFADENGEELLVGARLQLEAELICNSRLGGPGEEAARIIDLISISYRAGPEGHEETKFVLDVVQALGRDGQFGERYKDSYAAIGRALTELRTLYGVSNARMMLQEATLRRAHIHFHSLPVDEKAALLDEASRAVSEAIDAISRSGADKLYASRRTKDHLWVERAATYGYIATDAAQRNESATEVWSSYQAARDAGRAATGRVGSYHPLDISLWLPIGVLEHASCLGHNEGLEVQADIRATMDSIDPAALSIDDMERFERQRLKLGGVLNDKPLSDEAFEQLARIGSTAGYYLRARQMAPYRPDTGEEAEASDIAAARSAAIYLREHFDRIRNDPRSLVLLLQCEWTSQTGRWLFRGSRQPLPTSADGQTRLRSALLDLLALGEGSQLPRFRYLENVMNWLTGSEEEAIKSWRRLAEDTEYVDSSRVLNRHTVYDGAGIPQQFEGVIDRKIGNDRWSVLVPELGRHVDLLEGRNSPTSLAVGQTVRNFAISFNYIGPIADFVPPRARG
jgi:hypothetical protein